MKTETTMETLEQVVDRQQIPAPSTLDQVVDLIVRDAREEPKRYLDEVVVPGGGE